MSQEIERKFLVTIMPDLSTSKRVPYERFFIFRNGVTELRAQQKGDTYEIERKTMINNLTAEKIRMEISQPEFEALRPLASEIIIRDGYKLSSDPVISLKVYHGRYEGLVRVEVEFFTEAEAYAFQIPDWFGKEITDSVVSRDAKLVNLSDEEFKKFLAEN